MELQGMAPEVAKKFKYWQTRTIIASMIGYALFYFVRKNLSIAMPAMQDDLGITKGDLGLFLPYTDYCTEFPSLPTVLLATG